MKLYYFPGACSLADHIVLEWIGAPYQAVKVDLATRTSPDYLALNPNGTVPLLIDGDFVLSQNVAILYYLAERHPYARLLGHGTVHGRADVLRWLAFLNSDVHPAFKPIFKPNHFHPDASVARVIADTARSHVREYLERLDKRLQDRDWLANERSIADPYLFVLLRWTIRVEVDSRGLDNLARFFARMCVDPGVRAAVIAEEGRIHDLVRLRS
jgi:glutathione S-transferase